MEMIKTLKWPVAWTDHWPHTTSPFCDISTLVVWGVSNIPALVVDTNELMPISTDLVKTLMDQLEEGTGLSRSAHTHYTLWHQAPRDGVGCCLFDM